MIDYLSSLYFGEPITSPPDDPLRPFAGDFSRISAEMGEAFGQKLAMNLHVAFRSEGESAFQRGFCLGGQMMYTILED